MRFRSALLTCAAIVLAMAGCITHKPVAPLIVTPPEIMPPVIQARTNRAAVIPSPPKTSIYQWDIPAWEAYQFTMPTTPTTALQPATWLVRVTSLRSNNWTRCSSNVPITFLTRTAIVVVTNVNPQFIRAAYGWPTNR